MNAPLPADTWDEDESVPGAQRALLAEVVVFALHDVFSRKAATWNERVEAYRFLTDDTGPWARSRSDICGNLEIDPDVLRERIMKVLDGDLSPTIQLAYATPLDLEAGRELHRELLKQKAEAEAGRLAARRRREMDEPADGDALFRRLPVDVGEPLAWFEFVEVNGLPLGHVLRLDPWAPGAHCSVLRIEMPEITSRHGQVLRLVTSERGIYVPNMRRESHGVLKEIAAALGLEILYQDKDGNPVIARAGFWARLRWPPPQPAA